MMYCLNDVMKRDLEGKSLEVEILEFKVNSKSPPSHRAYLPGKVPGELKRDTRFSSLGKKEVTILKVSGETDPYEGSSFWIKAELGGLQLDISFDPEDNLCIS